MTLPFLSCEQICTFLKSIQKQTMMKPSIPLEQHVILGLHGEVVNLLIELCAPTAPTI